MCATYQIKLQGCSGSVADHLNDFYQTRSQKISRPPADPPQPYIQDPCSTIPLDAIPLQGLRTARLATSHYGQILIWDQNTFYGINYLAITLLIQTVPKKPICCPRF